MKLKKSKKDVETEIEDFFKKENLDSKYVRKIKRLAMKYHIRLKKYRKRFCKKCLKDLKTGKVRITKYYKTVDCVCGVKNKWKI